MNAAAKELPVSYDLSKPQEDKEPYIGSVLFFKHVIFTVTLLLILIPTTLYLPLRAGSQPEPAARRGRQPTGSHAGAASVDRARGRRAYAG